jgi:WS/DGAT/MGAT family acyltransferase
MQRLTGMDASFLYMESPTMHLHILGVIVIDASTMPGGYSFDKVTQVFRDRLHLLPPFRRRAVFVPFGLDHPVWIEDEGFDFDQHVQRIAAPAPGSLRELSEIVGHIASVPLDRSRPLWELTVVEGLEDDQVALVTKLHHSSIDGISGTELLVHLVDLTPDAKPVPPPEVPWVGEPVPSDLELVREAVVRAAARPARWVKVAYRTTQSMVDVVRTLRGPDADPALPLTAPHNLSGPLTPHRTVAFGRADLEDLKTIKNAFGTTVNDVVLAACTGSLRRYLADHGDLPERPLIASVPVSVRAEDDSGRGGNKVSAMFAALPVELDDPVEQLLEIHQRMQAAKELHHAVGADMLQNWSEMFGPAIFAQGSRLLSSVRQAQRAAGITLGEGLTIHNLIISNIPGPPMPLYVAGARVVATYPIGPVLFGAGLNLTVLSNMGSVDVSAVACPELVPDVAQIVDGFADAVEELKRLALPSSPKSEVADTAADDDEAPVRPNGQPEPVPEPVTEVGAEPTPSTPAAPI